MKSYMDIEDHNDTKPRINNFDRMRIKVSGACVDVTKYNGENKLYGRANSCASREE